MQKTKNNPALIRDIPALFDRDSMDRGVRVDAVSTHAKHCQNPTSVEDEKVCGRIEAGFKKRDRVLFH
jgi:hypothetical protein